MMPSKDEIARQLAEFHVTCDPEISHIFRLRSPNEQSPTEPIKLLEINPGCPPAGVVPVSFGPSGLVPYPSVIVEVTPDEFQQIRANMLELPESWEIGDELISVRESGNGREHE